MHQATTLKDDPVHHLSQTHAHATHTHKLLQRASPVAQKLVATATEKRIAVIDVFNYIEQKLLGFIFNQRFFCTPLAVICGSRTWN